MAADAGRQDQRAQYYPWSSAPHCAKEEPDLLVNEPDWLNKERGR